MHSMCNSFDIENKCSEHHCFVIHGSLDLIIEKKRHKKYCFIISLIVNHTTGENRTLLEKQTLSVFLYRRERGEGAREINILRSESN